LIVEKTNEKRRKMLGELRKWRKRREENKTMIFFFVAETENKIRKVRETTAKVDKVDKMKNKVFKLLL
jgi:uncharacterized protein YegL